jgi:hypothetical protein
MIYAGNSYTYVKLTVGLLDAKDGITDTG